MTKDQARVELKKLEEKAKNAIADAKFKIKTIDDALRRELDPIDKRLVELEKLIYDGKTRFEIFHETGRDPETGQTREEILGKMMMNMMGCGNLKDECDCPECQERRKNEDTGFQPPEGLEDF